MYKRSLYLGTQVYTYLVHTKFRNKNTGGEREEMEGIVQPTARKESLSERIQAERGQLLFLRRAFHPTIAKRLHNSVPHSHPYKKSKYTSTRTHRQAPSASSSPLLDEESKTKRNKDKK